MTNYPTESFWTMVAEQGWGYALRILWMAICMMDKSPARWARFHNICLDLPSALWVAKHAAAYAEEMSEEFAAIAAEMRT